MFAPACTAQAMVAPSDMTASSKCGDTTTTRPRSRLRQASGDPLSKLEFTVGLTRSRSDCSENRKEQRQTLAHAGAQPLIGHPGEAQKHRPAYRDADNNSESPRHELRAQ